MPQLLEWVQDVNWPVAQPLLLFLNKIGAPLAPYIRAILETDDEPWKWNVLWMIVEPSKDLRAVFRPDLERLANNPSAGERTEGLDVLAREILNLGDASH